MSLRVFDQHPMEGMTHRRDFSPTEWNTLRDTPYVVCIAVLLTGANSFAAIAELLDFTQRAMGGLPADTTLTRELTSPDEMARAQMSVKQSLRVSRGIPAVESIRRHALELVKSSSTIVATKSDSIEAKDYRNMLYRVAERVAVTARAEGFAGFHEEATDAVHVFFEEIRRTLGLELARKA